MSDWKAKDAAIKAEAAQNLAKYRGEVLYRRARNDLWLASMRKREDI